MEPHPSEATAGHIVEGLTALKTNVIELGYRARASLMSHWARPDRLNVTFPTSRPGETCHEQGRRDLWHPLALTWGR